MLIAHRPPRVQNRQPSEYQRPLNTDMIGSRLRLPRGRQCLTKDPDFFRSVHLVGEGLAREKEESKRQAEELWRSKVKGKHPRYPRLFQTSFTCTRVLHCW